MKTLFNTIYMSVNSHFKSSARSAQGLLQNLGLVMVALLFGSMQVWGATYSVTVDQNATGNNNVHITTTTKNSSQTVTYNDVSWTFAWAGNGVPNSGSRSQCQFGTSKKPCTSVTINTSGISGTITEVAVTTWGVSSNNAKVAVTVGDTDFTNGGNTTVAIGTSSSAKTFTHTGKSGEIVITISQTTNTAIYVSGISVTYSAGPTTYTVTYAAGGATSGSVPVDASSPYASGATVTVLGNTGNLAKSGFNFNGWLGDNGVGAKTAGQTFSMPAANVTMTAQWSAKTYTNYRTLCTTTNPSLSVSPTSLTGLDYIVGSGPSASQSFTVSGSNLGADLVVTAPANYEVCKTADGTYTSTISYTPSDGAVANTTAYIRLAAGLNVGTYNYAAASGLQVTSTGAKTRTAALNGTVTKADCAITFTDFNAVDHYEATLEYGSRVTVSYNYTYNGDGNFSISHSPATGTIDKANKTLTVSTAGIWTLNASATAGTNYSKPSDASAQIRVKCVDTYKDFIHNKTIKAYGSGTAVTDGKMEDWGSGYTVPYIDDNAEETSGSCQQTHYKFMGWVSEDDINIADGTFKTGWTLIQAGTESKLATTKTYYAVWAKLEE